ncbi:MFS transporter [Streptomyces sp. FXJ1.4098]|nr:MFS transporter [Streptomyces sp. FXJ1.4098]
MAVVTFVFLPNSPATARWLDPAHRDWLHSSLDAEQGTGHDEGVRAQLAALKNRRVLHLAVTHLALAIGTYGFNLFLPLIIKQINPDYSATNIGFLAAIPYICAAIGLLVTAQLSKRIRERKYLVAVPLALAASGLAGVIALRHHPGPAVFALAVTGVGPSPGSRRSGRWPPTASPRPMSRSHRHHQLHRQPGRVHRPVHRRQGDRRLHRHRGPADPRRVPGRVDRADPAVAQPGPAAGCRHRPGGGRRARRRPLTHPNPSDREPTCQPPPRSRPSWRAPVSSGPRARPTPSPPASSRPPVSRPSI